MPLGSASSAARATPFYFLLDPVLVIACRLSLISSSENFPDLKAQPVHRLPQFLGGQNVIVERARCGDVSRDQLPQIGLELISVDGFHGGRRLTAACFHYAWNVGRRRMSLFFDIPP